MRMPAARLCVLAAASGQHGFASAEGICGARRRDELHARPRLAGRAAPHRSEDLQGYPDAAWAAMRREIAARAVTSIMQRDHTARAALISSGGLMGVLKLLEDEVGPWLGAPAVCVWGGVRRNAMELYARVWAPGPPACGPTRSSPHPAPQSPGCERVQYYMASLLADMVLDNDAMKQLQVGALAAWGLQGCAKQGPRAGGECTASRARSGPGRLSRPVPC